jgi:hypothetical protein
MIIIQCNIYTMPATASSKSRIQVPDICNTVIILEFFLILCPLQHYVNLEILLLCVPAYNLHINLVSLATNIFRLYITLYLMLPLTRIFIVETEWTLIEYLLCKLHILMVIIMSNKYNILVWCKTCKHISLHFLSTTQMYLWLSQPSWCELP